MTLAELIRLFRLTTRDVYQPYEWEDDNIASWLSEAEQEAAIRGRLILAHATGKNKEICLINTKANIAWHPLHPSLYELESVFFKRTTDRKWARIKLVSAGWLDRKWTNEPGWRDETGFPKYAIQDDHGIRLIPSPNKNGKIRVEGYRLPLKAMERPEDTPEIHPAHHAKLVLWAVHRAISCADTERFDQQQANDALAEFTDYFGLATDSDLRRTTRHDVPHHVAAFWV